MLTSEITILKFKKAIWPIYHFCLRTYYNYKGSKEKKRNIDFSEYVTVKELNLSPDSSNDYEGITSRRLKKVMSLFNITDNDSILDYGCGKGKALYLLSSYNFKQVSGVEISPQLVEIAKKNMQVLNVKKIQIYLSDASNFKNINHYNYFFFYNPFPAVILNYVIRNIEESLVELPRKVTIIYYEPKHKHEFEKSKLFKNIMNKSKVMIYSN